MIPSSIAGAPSSPSFSTTLPDTGKAESPVPEQRNNLERKETIRALYRGAATRVPSALFMAGKTMALRSKLQVALVNMQKDQASAEDKLDVVNLLSNFNYPEGLLPDTLSKSISSDNPELAQQIHDALWKQCQFFNPDPKNRSLESALLSYIILASRSATLALEKWCDEHKMTANGQADVVIVQQLVEPKSATEEQRHRLGVGTKEELKYRYVHLVCEGRVLSEADNWYVPGRLTEEMNHLLETTDIPFGKVVRGLNPYRTTFDVDMTMQNGLFEHKAILYSSDGKPFSEVHERYQPRLLDYPLPSRLDTR